jgi:hypothetical protein
LTVFWRGWGSASPRSQERGGGQSHRLTPNTTLISSRWKCKQITTCMRVYQFWRFRFWPLQIPQVSSEFSVMTCKSGVMASSRTVPREVARPHGIPRRHNSPPSHFADIHVGIDIKDQALSDFNRHCNVSTAFCKTPKYQLF